MLDALAQSIRNLRKKEREKLEAIGQVAAEIVHDINNHCQLLLQKVRREPLEDRRVVEMIEQETALLQNMALDVLDFSRDRLVLRLESINISRLAEMVEGDIRHLLSAHPGVRFVLMREGQDCAIRVDAGRIRRLFLNLARNALEALGAKGQLSIEFLSESDFLYITSVITARGFPRKPGADCLNPFPIRKKNRAAGSAWQ